MDWLRLYHGTISDKKWPIISRVSGQPKHIVVVVWIALLEHASEAEDRGSVAGFNPDEIDAVLDLPDGATKAVFDALCERSIVRNFKIAAWSKRQPKREDGSAERAKAWREQRKAKENNDEGSANANERTRTQVLQTVNGTGKKSAENAISDDFSCCKIASAESENNNENDALEETNANERKRTQTNVREEKNNIILPPPSPPASGVGVGVQCSAPSPTSETEPVARKAAGTNPRYSASFEAFWQAYPSKVGKGAAAKAWEKIGKSKTATVPQIMAALKAQVEARQWLGKDGQDYIPNPTTWLNQSRWEDEIKHHADPRGSPETPVREERYLTKDEVAKHVVWAFDGLQ